MARAGDCGRRPWCGEKVNRVSAEDVLAQTCCLFRVPPHFCKGVLRQCLRLAFDLVRCACDSSLAANWSPAWKLLLLAFRMLLHRPSGGIRLENRGACDGCRLNIFFHFCVFPFSFVRCVCELSCECGRCVLGHVIQRWAIDAILRGPALCIGTATLTDRPAPVLPQSKLNGNFPETVPRHRGQTDTAEVLRLVLDSSL